jgi:Ser/Thr protein kinase RdoA (MazF antagonist)
MSQTDYAELSPDVILDALESVDLRAEYSIIPLNSYENRVHLLTLENGQRIVSKFYRPLRWSDEQILEEHQFSFELAEREIPVVAPMLLKKKSLFEYNGFRFSVFAAKGGRNIEIENLSNLEWMGRFLARIHEVGSQASYQYRPSITPESYGRASLTFLNQCERIPDYMRESYLTVAQMIVEEAETAFAKINPDCFRIHGDCHPSNVMWTDSGPHFVDFDDSRNGPAIQDLWMLMSSDAEDMQKQWDAILTGYEEFRTFDEREVQLIEPLRGLRMLHYTSWIGQRWSDPSFQHHFSWFDSHRYWEEQTLHLKEQLSLIHNPPLKLFGGNC